MLAQYINPGLTTGIAVTIDFLHYSLLDLLLTSVNMEV